MTVDDRGRRRLQERRGQGSPWPSRVRLELVDETEIPNGRPATLFDTNLYGILYLLVVPVQKKEPK